jgi:hypothetical protein
VTFVFFGSSQSTSFECEYKNSGWSTFDKIYYCDIQNTVNITSLDEAQIHDISGTHEDGYNNDNVVAFTIQKVQIHYFPRGLNKIFKNLKGIQIAGVGLKEIHQSDLKDFPNLINLILYNNNLEILEENLFEFNPNLHYIFLYSNKISHIDRKVFHKLTKLKILYLTSNTCINMYAYSNPTALQNIIKTAKAQCVNTDYSNLEQKVKNLEIESKYLSSENLKEKLEKLENEIKKSKFQNFFQQHLQDLKAAQIEKTQEEASKTTPKPATTTTIATTTTTEAPKFETCSALESKIDDIAANLNYCIDQAINGTNSIKVDNNNHQNEQCAAIREDLRNQTEAIERIDTRTEAYAESMDTRLEILEENVENFKMSALREIMNINNAVKDAHHGLMMSMNMKTDKIEKQIKKIEEQNRSFEEKLAKIMKALKIAA